MIYRSPQNPYSHLTVKERQQASLPVRHLHEKGLLKGKILDFGSGLGTDVAFMRAKGHDVEGYDPHYAPAYPSETYDTVICFYVLNVLLPIEQSHVLMAISELLKPEGTAYFAVRRDIMHSGFRYNPKRGVKTYQHDVKLPYPSQYRTKYMEIYRYRHYTTLYAGDEHISPFFKSSEPPMLITESAQAFSISDKYPVNQGHALIIPKEKEADYFALSPKSLTACQMVLKRTKQILSTQYNPQGWNIGINIEQTAGQTIPHAHIHLIPRYTGDVENPTGGVRNVIPGKGDYLE